MNFVISIRRYWLKQKQHIRKISDADLLAEITETLLAEMLIEKLKNIRTGALKANAFHDYCIGVLEFLFYPLLNNPQKEQGIHEGRKRIDITFNNNASNGFFFEMRTTPSTRSSMLIIECKNYSHDPANPELDQLAGRFSPLRGQFGILIARNFQDRTLFLKRCVDTAKDQRGIIIPLSDEDIIAMLESVSNNRRINIEDRLRKIYMEIISG